MAIHRLIESERRGFDEPPNGMLLEYYVPFPSLDDLALDNRFSAKRSLCVEHFVGAGECLTSIFSCDRTDSFEISA